MSRDTSCLKVFAVPELVNQVHGYLSRQDLARCTRVCKVFLEAMTPVLWHTVSIKSLRQHQVFTTSPEIQEALSRNCAHIRVIRLQSCKSLGPFLNLNTASLTQLRVHTLEFPWPESIPHKCIISRNGDPVPEQEESLRSLQEGLDLESILEPSEPRDPELCAMMQNLADGHPRDWLQNPSTFLMRQQVQGYNERLHRYLRRKHFETEQYVLKAQSWIKKYPPRYRFADGTLLPPPPPPLMSNELQFILRITAYSSMTYSLDTHLRKRAMILLTLQVSALQSYQQQLDATSSSDVTLTFREVQDLIQEDIEHHSSTEALGTECLDMQMEMQRQLYMEIQCQRNNAIARPEFSANPLQAQICVQLQHQANVAIHQQIAVLYDKEQSFHVLQKLIRQLTPQPPCQEGGHWRSSASTELPSELVESLRELLQELSSTPVEDDLQKLADGFEKLVQARSKDEYEKLYTTKISQIQGWIASHKVYQQSKKLSCPPRPPLNTEEDEDSPPPSPTFEQVIPRFIHSYRVSVVNTPDSDIPWHRDGLKDEQLLIQFLKQIPSDSLQVFSNNKFSFRNRALLELLASSAERLPGLSCLSMFRHDASAVISQLIGPRTPWYQEDLLGMDPFTTEIDWFLHRCPVQLHTLRIAIEGSLEPVHARIAEQRNRTAMNKTPPILTLTAIKHLSLEGPLALSSQPEFLKRCPDLQSLSLSCTMAYPLLHLAPMIVHCPKIEDLAISSPELPDVEMTQSIAAFIRGCAPSSSSSTHSSASLTYSTVSTTTTLERMGLKRLRLENLLVTQDGILEALQLCAPTLTHLAIRDCQLPMRNIPQSGTNASPSIITFNDILETFTQLQELDVLCTPKYANPQPFRGRSVVLHGKFDAQHLMALRRPAALSQSGGLKTWACYKTLKVLRIEIHGICRTPPPPCTRLPDTCTTFVSATTTGRSFPAPASFPIAAAVAAARQRDQEGPDPEQIKEGYRLQREVCLLLGTLSSLEELCLGTLNVPGDDRPPALPGLSRWRGGSYGVAAGIQTQCLELSLSTGLELMGGMKEMRVLKVGGLEHRIGLGEIQWMCEHWPKLEAVCGLLRVKNRAQHDPDWEGKDEDDEMESEMVDWIRKNRPCLRYT
ncbi:hypothetical protein BGZ70_007970 [Mortierella alpina]|uniref:F-box domain-containing protein n=1 Tax=Mortierella alpina TaxID=64518 RepID=A0A9P6J522_MORAP|nr:hypothetical protein BGZ70_007970 [Mortierella alpina]